MQRAYGGWCKRAPVVFTRMKRRESTQTEKMFTLWQSYTRRLGPTHASTLQMRKMYEEAYEQERGRKPF